MAVNENSGACRLNAGKNDYLYLLMLELDGDSTDAWLLWSKCQLALYPTMLVEYSLLFYDGEFIENVFASANGNYEMIVRSLDGSVCWAKNACNLNYDIPQTYHIFIESTCCQELVLVVILCDEIRYTVIGRNYLLCRKPVGYDEQVLLCDFNEWLIDACNSML